MVFLEEGRNTIAYYSNNPNPKNLLIFVHGFGGKSVGTWGDFPIYIKNFAEYNSCDVIFYGYKSMKTPAIGSSELFYQHLKKFVNPRITIGNTSRGDAIEEYKNIVFIGHSLGAIIIRRTLLDAKKDNPSWLSNCKIILFAPAHRGAHIHRLIIEAIPDLFRAIGSAAKILFNSLNDLEAGSDTITDLINDNNKYLSDKKNDSFTKAAYIMAAVNDKVVLKNRFCDDPNVEPIEEKGHISICKPILGKYENPINPLKRNIL